jgi:hypothetical protein
MRTGAERYCYEKKKIISVGVSKGQGLMVPDFCFLSLGFCFFLFVSCLLLLLIFLSRYWI